MKVNTYRILKKILLAIAVVLAVCTIGLFLYPFIKSFLIYQGGVQEQEAFNAVVIPLIIKGFLFAFLCGICAMAALGGVFYCKDRIEEDAYNNGVHLERIGVEEAESLWEMQVEAFKDLYEKYRDTETSPATETMEKVKARLEQEFTYYYYIYAAGYRVGAIRVVDKNEEGVRKRISPLFILPHYRRQGYAKKAMDLVEEMHGPDNWELDTIQEEEGNCRLYEKLGYVRDGNTKVINDRMTLVFYKKD